MKNIFPILLIQNCYMKSTFSKKTLLSLFFAISTLALSSCREDKPCTDNGLPCLTHEGKNTFGCLIDGMPFVAKTSFSIGGAVPVSGSFDEATNLLIIEGAREDSQEHVDIVRFLVYVTSGINEYNIHVVNEYDGYVDYSGVNCSFQHTPTNKGKVSITHLDVEKNIISGTFQMTLVNPDCSKETLIISQGRFDFGY